MSSTSQAPAELLRQHPLRFVCSWRGNTSGYFPLHSHPVIELVYHPLGAGVTTLGNGQKIDFEPHGTVIYPAWLQHDQRMTTAGADICLHLEARGAVEELFSGAYYIPPQRIGANRADRFVRSEFLQLAQVRSDPTRQAELDLRSTALVARLLQLGRPAGQETAPISAEIYRERARHYIRDHHAKITSIGEVARHVGVSEHYLRHLFSERGEASLSKLLNQVKIARAKELLIHSGLSLKEIAALSGFQTERYLSTRFKKLTGTTPGTFRRENRGAPFAFHPAPESAS